MTFRRDGAFNIYIEYLGTAVLRASVLVSVKLLAMEMNTFDTSFYLNTHLPIKIFYGDIICIAGNAMSNLVFMLTYGEACFVCQFFRTPKRIHSIKAGAPRCNVSCISWKWLHE